MQVDTRNIFEDRDQVLMYVPQTIRHGKNLPYTLPTPPWTPCHWGLSFGNYHIHNGRGFELAEAVWVTWIDGFNLMILTETNITDQAYCQNRMGYDVVISKAITAMYGDSQGGVGTIVWD